MSFRVSNIKIIIHQNKTVSVITILFISGTGNSALRGCAKAAQTLGETSACGKNAKCIDIPDGDYYCQCRSGYFGNPQHGGQCSADLINSFTVIPQALTIPIAYKNDLSDTKSATFLQHKEAIEEILAEELEKEFENYIPGSLNLYKFLYVKILLENLHHSYCRPVCF